MILPSRALISSLITDLLDQEKRMDLKALEARVAIIHIWNGLFRARQPWC
jgi:hypothetical protein